MKRMDEQRANAIMKDACDAIEELLTGGEADRLDSIRKYAADANVMARSGTRILNMVEPIKDAEP
jgi:hypothetical protein